MHLVVAVLGVSGSSHYPTAMHLASAQSTCCGLPRAAFVSMGVASCCRNFLTTSSFSSSGCKRARHDASSTQAGDWHTARHRPCVPSHGTARERKYNSLLISLAQKQTVAWDAGAAEAVAKAEESESGSDASGSSHRHHHHPPLGLKEERRRAPLSHPPPTPKVVVQSREVRAGNRCATTTDAEEGTADADAAVEGKAQLGGRIGLEGEHGTGEHRLSAFAGDHLLGVERDVDVDDPPAATAAAAAAAAAASAAAASVTAATAAVTGAPATGAATAAATAAAATAAADDEEVVDEAERRAAERRVVRARRQRDRRRKERATLAAKKALVKKVILVHYVNAVGRLIVTTWYATTGTASTTVLLH